MTHMLVGQEEIENDITVKTYPNPTSDFFTVSMEGHFTLQAKADLYYMII